MGAIKEQIAALYDADFLAWTAQQAQALRSGDWRALDVANLVEEVESMGKQLQAELTNRLAVLLAHLLKWQHQPVNRPTHGRSWNLTVTEQRRQVQRLMRKNPSLQSFVGEAMDDAYGDAILIAAREGAMSTGDFPAPCPWTFAQVMREDWMPD